MPHKILRAHKNITIAIDIMFICSLPFVISVSRRVKLITGEWVPTMTKKQLVASLHKTVGLYWKGGFKVVVALLDG